MISLDIEYLKKYKKIIGLDEAGRGPLAGPVFTAAVVSETKHEIELLSKIGADSKKISEKEREKRYDYIIKNFKYKINFEDESVIDEINIFKATNLSMKKNVKNFDISNAFLMVDGKNFVFDTKYECIVKGDEKSPLIGAASILAKVSRDRYMYRLDEIHPNYGFKQHKGYPTKKHIENIISYGITKDYRITFNPIKRFLLENKIYYNKNDFSKYRLLKIGLL